MEQITWWDIALVAIAGLVSVIWLVRLMRIQRDAVIEELRDQAAQDQTAREKTARES